MSGTIVQNPDGTATLVHPFWGPIHTVSGPDAASLLQQAYPTATFSGTTTSTAPAPSVTVGGASTTPSLTVTAPTVSDSQIQYFYNQYLNRTPRADEVAFWRDYSTKNSPEQTLAAFQQSSRKEIGDFLRSGYASKGVSFTEADINAWTDRAINEGIVNAQKAWDASTTPKTTTTGTTTTGTTTPGTTTTGTTTPGTTTTGTTTTGTTTTGTTTPGTTPVDYSGEVNNLYSRYLNRTPSASEISFWSNYYKTNTPEQTLAAFKEGARKELGDVLASGYNSVLGRTPTESELKYWVDYALDKGVVQAAAAFNVGARDELAAKGGGAPRAATGNLVSELTGNYPYGSGGGIYKRTPQEEFMYQGELARIPITTTIANPVIPTTTTLSPGMARIRASGEMTPEQYYANIREGMTSGKYTKEQQDALLAGAGATAQDVGVAMGTIARPITFTAPTMPGATAGTTQSIGQFIQSKIPPATPTTEQAGPVFTPAQVTAQLELERLKAANAPPAVGLARGGDAGSESRRMLSKLGGAPVKKFSDGGSADESSSDVDLAEQMTVGTLPRDREPGKAEEAFRALVEGGQGFLGLEPGRRGSEAYRTGQALSNLPALALPAAAIKGTGKAKDVFKSLTKKDIKEIASELETSRGQLTELVKKYPQLREASIADVAALTKGEDFPVFRGISLLPGRTLEKETTPSMTLEPRVALGMLRDAPVMMTKEGFITATPVLRQYPGMKASETQVYVPSLIEQITERQPGALEMKIPTRSGDKMTVADIFKEVKGEKELLADVSKKDPRDILFNRYQGGIGDRYLMEVARKVLTGEWKGGEELVKEIGGYQTDPAALAKEFDDFAKSVSDTLLKKAQGGEVSTTDFIRKRQAGSPPEGEVPTDDYIQRMFTGTPPLNRATNPGLLPPELRQAVDVPLDFLNLLIRGGAGAVAGPAYGLYKGITSDKYGTPEGVQEASSEAARMMAKITGEPKTQTARDILEYIGEKAEQLKLAPTPQLLTAPLPGPGAASALMRNYQLAETPPEGVIKLPGGNYLAGQVEKALAPLKHRYFGEDTDPTQIKPLPNRPPEDPGMFYASTGEALTPQQASRMQAEGTINKWIDSKLTKYVKNDMATERDPLRLQADKWATEQQPKLLAEKDAQIAKAKADMEKAQRERGVEPEMLTRSRARILELEKEREFIAARTGLHYTPPQTPELYRGGVNFARQNYGFPRTATATSEAGKLWEDLSDRFFMNRSPAEEVRGPAYFMRDTDAQRIMAENPWLSNVPPETQVQFLNRGLSQQDTGFKHMTDELRNALNPDSGLPSNLQISTKDLEKMTVPQAADLVDRINAHRAVQKAEADKLAAQKSIEVYKEYPKTEQGLRWVEIKMLPYPETLPEGFEIVNKAPKAIQVRKIGEKQVISGKDLKDVIDGIYNYYPDTPGNSRKALEEALRYEGDIMQHCVGGYCPDVISGESRIFSLRDSSGRPHATVEVAPDPIRTWDDVSNVVGPEEAARLWKEFDATSGSRIKKKDDAFQEFIEKKGLQAPAKIKQIKGVRNQKPADEYIPFVQDFVKSQRWSSVGDINNTGLIDLRDTSRALDALGTRDLGELRRIKKVVKDDYITPEELAQFRSSAGYASGGEVTKFIKAHA